MAMTYEMKPLACNPARLSGLSEKLMQNINWDAVARHCRRATKEAGWPLAPEVLKRRKPR